MKINLMTIFVIAMFCLKTNNSVSQNYYPIGSAIYIQSKGWDMVLGSLEYQYLYTSTKDTVINGLTYRSFSEQYKYFQQNVLKTSTTTNAGLLIRQNGKKVYRYYKSQNQDHLIYDCSLQVGDSAYVGNNPNYKCPITKIDSFLFNGTYRKKFTYNNTDAYLYEGMSFKHGISDFRCSGGIGVEGDTYFICYKENNIIYRPPTAPSTSTCIIPTSNTGVVEVDDIDNLILIQKSNSIWTIENLHDRTLNINLTDLSGKLFSSIKLRPREEYTIPNIEAKMKILLLTGYSDKIIFHKKLLID